MSSLKRTRFVGSPQNTTPIRETSGSSIRFDDDRTRHPFVSEIKKWRICYEKYFPWNCSEVGTCSHTGFYLFNGLCRNGKKHTMRLLLLALLFPFSLGASAEELKELTREFQVKLFVENNTKGRKCDYPISMKMLEEVKDVYFITETW